ncbi:MAG: NAD(+) synthase [Clostridiales bacterium]|nr:NAD(+) synthase [Clostridiales bacterium]
MNFGFVKVGAFSPEIKVADVNFNTKQIIDTVCEAEKQGVQVLVFAELSITGSTVGDLFYSDTLLDSAKAGLKEIAAATQGKNIIIFVGLPFKNDGLIYNVCAGIADGTILGLVPKTYMPDNDAVNQKRYFATENSGVCFVSLDRIESEEDIIPFGKSIIFVDQKVKIAVEFGDYLTSLSAPTVTHAVNGANIVVNLSALAEFSGAAEQRVEAIKAQSKKAVCAYVFANAGYGESTTDMVFSGQGVICENGDVLAQRKPFENKLCTAEIDLSSIEFERAKIFNQDLSKIKTEPYFVGFSIELSDKFTRVYEKFPFIKQGEEEFLIEIAAQGLKKRIEHIRADKVVIGISGGLDSTLALIIASKTMKLLGKSSKDIVAITMPCFGTSSRTFDNSVTLSKAFGATLKKIEITKAVKRHLKDISHPEDLHDAAYENSQARERTQVLMDYANSCNGIVVGTGDLSELALGWATYNGDHMSMYAVNGSIPKTLVRHLVDFTANNGKGKFKAVLKDILDTPVSPELIPSKDNTIGQVTEDIVGPYTLHDFFLYNIVKRGFTPAKTYYAAVNTFDGEFDKQTILKWLKTFVRRFFMQQFKRSCLPDGVKVTEISLSPRGSWRMPSDAVSKLWLDELENLD